MTHIEQYNRIDTEEGQILMFVGVELSYILYVSYVTIKVTHFNYIQYTHVFFVDIFKCLFMVLLLKMVGYAAAAAERTCGL